VFDHPGQFGGEIWGDLDRLLTTMGRYGPNRVIAKLKPGTEIGAPDPSAQFGSEVPEAGVARILAEYVGPEHARETVDRALGVDSWVALVELSEPEIEAQLQLADKGAEAAGKVSAYVREAAKQLEPVPGSMAARLLKDPEVPAKVYSEKQFQASQTVMLTFVLGFLGLSLAVIMGTAAVFTAANTMLSALAARTHEIGILLAMGYRPVPIFLSFMFEALLLGVIGGLAGCVLALPFNGVRAGTMNFQTFTEMAFAFRVTPVVLGIAISFSLMLGLLGGAWPAWRAARLKPTLALRQG
jgi:putative ABC transport system permease protein